MVAFEIILIYFPQPCTHSNTFRVEPLPYRNGHSVLSDDKHYERQQLDENEHSMETVWEVEKSSDLLKINL